MKDRFAVLDPDYRDVFEKKWQMPFGYGSCFISDNMNEAIDHIKEINGKNLVVERFNSNGREVVYKS
jgi:hypothetical protein